jgi:hypothetical protein
MFDKKFWGFTQTHFRTSLGPGKHASKPFSPKQPRLWSDKLALRSCCETVFALLCTYTAWAVRDRNLKWILALHPGARKHARVRELENDLC